MWQFQFYKEKCIISLLAYLVVNKCFTKEQSKNTCRLYRKISELKKILTENVYSYTK